MVPALEALNRTLVSFIAVISCCICLPSGSIIMLLTRFLVVLGTGLRPLEIGRNLGRFIQTGLIKLCLNQPQCAAEVRAPQVGLLQIGVVQLGTCQI